ncbi:MAG: terpene cyclase/mutase family protein, partial [Planctomycetales bacterium]|nr:terpene cyclase/mutase family protein [Planctomycetales bacterium]
MSWQIATSGLPVRSVSFVLVFIIVVGVGPEPASALDPSSPQVRSMIGRAKTYLESRQAEESRLGGRCLVGAVFMKDGQKNHPLVMEAVEACREASRATDVSYDVYSLGISIMFLVDLDSEEYRSEIQRLLDRLMRIQKDFGGWGYTSGPSVLTGDTSMTQYAVLALWTSHQRGYVRSSEPVQRVAAWLLRTQDPSGAWGYQGRDPGEYTRIEQSEVRHSLAAAGLGSTYMCADMLGMAKSMVGRRGRSSPENSDAELPPALKLVVEESGTKKLAGGRVDPSVLSRAIRDGNTWFEKNFTIKTEEWNYYYLYGLE